MADSSWLTVKDKHKETGLKVRIKSEAKAKDIKGVRFARGTGP